MYGMGSCWSLTSASSGHSNSNTYTAGDDQLGSSQFCTHLSNTTSTTTSNNNTSSISLWGSENSQITRVRSDQEEIHHGQILDAANLRVFTLAELKAATKNFRDDTVLGEGGFGRVYKGFIKERAASKRGQEMPMDAKLEGKYPPNLASQVAQLTLKCLQEDPKIRPSMQQVVETLEQIEAANDKPADNNNRNRARVLLRHGQPDDG